MLLEEDYEYLRDISQEYEEVEAQRYLIFKDFPLPESVYESAGLTAINVDVLIEMPSIYNNAGPDMFWTAPYLTLAGGATIKAAGQGSDTRTHNGVIFERWSRHWGKAGWRPRQDCISTVVDRINWAFANPDPDAV